MTLSLVAVRHDEWIRIAIYLGCLPCDAEDLVQDLYLKLGAIEQREGSLERLMYQGKINKAYMFSALGNMITSIRRKGKTQYLEDVDLKFVMYEDQYDPTLFEDEYIDLIESVNDKLESMYWYDSKMLKTYVHDNHSIRSLAKATRISPRSIHNTIKNVKEKIKHDCKEEYDCYQKAKSEKNEAKGIRRQHRTNHQGNRD